MRKALNALYRAAKRLSYQEFKEYVKGWLRYTEALIRANRNVEEIMKKAFKCYGGDTELPQCDKCPLWFSCWQETLQKHHQR